MHAVVRTYSGKGAKELVDALIKHKAEVEKLMRPIKGFVSYTLVNSGDGCVSVTVCETKAGTDESIVAAKGWIAKNVPTVGIAAMSVSEGSVIVHLK